MASSQGLKQTTFGKDLENDTLLSGQLQTPFLMDSNCFRILHSVLGVGDIAGLSISSLSLAFGMIGGVRVLPHRNMSPIY